MGRRAAEAQRHALRGADSGAEAMSGAEVQRQAHWRKCRHRGEEAGADAGAEAGVDAQRQAQRHRGSRRGAEHAQRH